MICRKPTVGDHVNGDIEQVLGSLSESGHGEETDPLVPGDKKIQIAARLIGSASCRPEDAKIAEPEFRDSFCHRTRIARSPTLGHAQDVGHF